MRRKQNYEYLGLIAAEHVVAAMGPSNLLPKDLRRPLLKLKREVERGQLAFMERFAEVLEEKHRRPRK